VKASEHENDSTNLNFRPAPKQQARWNEYRNEVFRMPVRNKYAHRWRKPKRKMWMSESGEKWIEKSNNGMARRTKGATFDAHTLNHAHTSQQNISGGEMPCETGKPSGNGKEMAKKLTQHAEAPKAHAAFFCQNSPLSWQRTTCREVARVCIDRF
jgi:hypothetical protein